LEIKKIQLDNAAYANLISENKPVFNTPDWLQLYKEGLNLYGVFGKNNILIAAFCLYNFKKLGVDFYINPIFCSNNLFVYKSDAIHKVSKDSFLKEIFEAIATYFSQAKKSVVEFTFAPPHIDMQPFIWAKYNVQPKYTYHLDLLKSESELLEELTVERRGNITSANKKGLKCEITFDYGITKDLILKTVESQKVKIDKKLLDKIFLDFSNAENSFSYITYNDSKPLATTFCVYDKKFCYYLAGGYDRIDKSAGAGALAMWNSILHAKKLGVKTFDFEGSMIPAIEKYFRGFGGELKPVFQVSKSSKIVKLGLSIMDVIKG
jgi:Acetyltransferase (GNAT) domain